MRKDYAIVAIIIGIIGGVLFIRSGKNQSYLEPDIQPDVAGTSGDMSDHHKPPASAEDSTFKSLLGKPAPEFELESFAGPMVKLSDFKEKKVVLFFSEGAMCYPSCWDQMVAFKKDSDFNKKDTVVVSIVVDPKSEWEGVVKKMPELKDVLVLLDTDRKVSKVYGVLTLASSMHRGQFPGHTYLVIDKEGIVRGLLDDEQMLLRNKEVLAELNKIS